MGSAIRAFKDQTLSKDDRKFLATRANSIRETAKRTVEGIVFIGQWLTECKQRLSHGQWLPWLKAEFGWSRNTAWRFMSVYEQVKCSKLEQLEIDVSALYLLSAPSTPEPVRQEAVRRAQTGERITHATALELVPPKKKPSNVSAKREMMDVLPIESDYEVRMRKEKQDKLAKQQADVMELFNAIQLIAGTAVTPKKMIELSKQHRLQHFSKLAWFWLNQILEQGETIQ